MHNISPERMDAITAAIFAGKKIQAIKLYREATGEGLKEAKEFVDSLTLRLREESPAQFEQAPTPGCASVVLLTIASLGGMCTVAALVAMRFLV